MNRTHLLALPLLLLGHLGCAAANPSYALEPPVGQESPRAERSADWKAVEAACLDYVEGIHDVDPARIERSVDRKLVKLGFWRKSEREDFVRAEMTYE